MNQPQAHTAQNPVPAFGFGEDEIQVRDAARRFLSQEANLTTVRKLVAADHVAAYESERPPVHDAPELWHSMVEQGWTALAVPEAAGGLGMSLACLTGVVEALGRHALPCAFESTVLATLLLRATEAGQAQPWLERIVAGDRASLAIASGSGSQEIGDTPITAQVESGQLLLSGTAAFVQDARKTDLFIVAARHADGVGWYAVPADTAGVTIHPDRILDLTRDQARIEFDRVALDAGSELTQAGEAAWKAALPGILTLVSADIAGAAEQQLQAMAEYARVRTQFGRPLGFFQAVKHPIVNVMLAVDETLSLVHDAAFACDHEPERAELAARMAKASAAETALFVANRSMQMHGGIAMTWEADIHIHFKRQLHSRALFGDARHHRQAIARLMWA